MTTIKIMSFNMRTSFAKDGDNSFCCRKDKIKDMICAEDPDVIGFQEITPEMRDFIVSTFDAYYTVGAGRGKTYNDESYLRGYLSEI